MKKTYQRPLVEVIEIKGRSHLLAGSGESINSAGNVRYSSFQYDGDAESGV